jgi:hypothetical protein
VKFNSLKHIASAAAILFSILTPEFSNCFAQGTGFTYQGRLDDGGPPANGVSSLNGGNVTDTIQYDGTTKTLIIDPPTGNRFYRLFKP